MSSPYRFSQASRKPSPVGIGCMCIFFAFALLAGLSIIGMLTAWPMLKAATALSWEQTPATVDSSEVKTFPGSGRNGTTYRVDIAYHYDFHGARYTSDQFEFSTASSSGHDGKQRVVDQYPPGTQTVCFVNPRHPTEAVIHRGLNVQMLFGLIGLPFALVGVFGFWFVSKVARGPAPVRKNAVPTFTPATGESVELKPQMTPVGKFFLMLLFGLFWNGMMSVFVYFVFFSPSHEGVPLFAKIIVGLFAAIGVLIIFSVIGSFLQLFNPRVVLNARTNAVPLGGEFQFEWSIRGQIGRVQKLRIVLVGREDATYHAGKSSQTATQVFAEIPVLETSEHELVREGQGRVTIPSDLMHSFNGGSNRISWRLQVRGEIPRWPDLDQEHMIQVLPHGATAA